MSPRGEDRPPERPEEPERPEKPERPEYTVYGAGGRKLGKKRAPKREEPPAGEDAPQEADAKAPETEAKPQEADAKAQETQEKREKPKAAEAEGKRPEPAAPAEAPARKDKPEYRVYRSRPGLRDRFRKPDLGSLRRPSPGLRDRLSGGGDRRWLRWVLIGVAAWFAISFVAFAISAQIQKGKLPDSAKQALEGGPDLLAGQNVLILGGDRRGQRQAQATGIEAQGPPRADTIMVLHASLISFRKLSIPRDVYAAIPDCGEQRINASFACNTNSRDGNPASTIRTVENFLGIPIHHIVMIDFDGFADFINTLGGIKVKIGRKVCGDIDGGKRNGGVSIQLKHGEHTLQGDKALALARIRENRCQPNEDDTARAARQQVILNGIKGRLTSPLRLPYNFLKGPWIGWNAPKAFVSDMGGFTLPQLAIAAIFGGGGESNVLGKGPNDEVLASPGPGGSIFIGEGECRRAVEQLTGSDPRQDPACSPG